MQALLITLAEQARAYSLLEIVAVLAAIAYLLLAIRQNIWCWLYAGISTAIFVYLFASARLYMESALNVFYFAMAVYGWSVWTSGRSGDSELPVVVWPVSLHARAITIVIIASLVSGYLLSRYTNAEFPYIDSMTTWGSMWATFLIARKVLENWWYWLLIDVVSIFIYWSRDLQLTSVLFVAYVVMIPFGLVSWSRTLRVQRASS